MVGEPRETFHRDVQAPRCDPLRSIKSPFSRDASRPATANHRLAKCPAKGTVPNISINISEDSISRFEGHDTPSDRKKRNGGEFGEPLQRNGSIVDW